MSYGLTDPAARQCFVVATQRDVWKVGVEKHRRSNNRRPRHNSCPGPYPVATLVMVTATRLTPQKMGIQLCTGNKQPELHLVIIAIKMLAYCVTTLFTMRWAISVALEAVSEWSRRRTLRSQKPIATVCKTALIRPLPNLSLSK
jgi:hypothetical protein